MKLNEDLIVIKPEEAKEKLTSLVNQIKNEKDEQVKKSLLTLLSIYLFQTHKPSDLIHKGCNITDAEWDEFSDFLNFETEDKLEEAIEIHDELNPKIWTKENELIPEVRAKILQIVDKFKNQLAVDGVDLTVDDIYLLGSNANFNYNEDSDLDIHIIADESFDCSKEHLAIIYNCYKALFNKKYDIKIKGINVELYVENKDKLSNVSAGIYSFKDGWIKTPSKFKIPEFDQVAVDRGVKIWEDKYFDITLEPTVKKIDDYLDSIYELRKESIQKDGEFSEGNLVFKEIRRLGYLDDLRELKIELTSQELSLESLEEGQEKIRFYYRGPVYHFEHIISRDWEAYTAAVSEKQALNNLTVKAKNYFGYILQSRITLDPKYLQVSPKLEPEQEFKEISKCEKCGRLLNHSGECPLCDLGDESVLDEILNESTNIDGENSLYQNINSDKLLVTNTKNAVKNSNFASNKGMKADSKHPRTEDVIRNHKYFTFNQSYKDFNIYSPIKFIRVYKRNDSSMAGPFYKDTNITDYCAYKDNILVAYDKNLNALKEKIDKYDYLYERILH